METLQNIQNFLIEQTMIINYCLWSLYILAMISFLVFFSRGKKEIKKEKEKRINTQISMGKLVDMMESLQKENAHILRVNQGMCLRKESISKEIIDDLNLRKTAIGEALRVVREGHFNINAPDVANVITETADGIYDFLTGK